MAIATVEGVNDYFKPCGIAFQLEAFEELDPIRNGLPRDISSEEDVSLLTRALTRSQDFLVISAGRFFGDYDQFAGVGNGQKRNYQLAAVRESEWTSAHVVAHELGHNLGLAHEPDKKNIMYRIENKNSFTSEQCMKMKGFATQQHSLRFRESFPSTPTSGSVAYRK